MLLKRRHLLLITFALACGCLPSGITQGDVDLRQQQIDSFTRVASSAGAVMSASEDIALRPCDPIEGLSPIFVLEDIDSPEWRREEERTMVIGKSEAVGQDSLHFALELSPLDLNGGPSPWNARIEEACELSGHYAALFPSSEQGNDFISGRELFDISKEGEKPAEAYGEDVGILTADAFFAPDGPVEGE